MIDRLKEITKELTSHLSSDEVLINVIKEGESYKISIETKDEKSFVGKDNERFVALSHLLKRMLSKILGEEVKIFIDINNLRGKNDEALKSKASILAERARAFKKDVELDPMSSYERRVIHSFLEGAPFIKTESIGDGATRRLVIKYVEHKETI